MKDILTLVVLFVSISALAGQKPSNVGVGDKAVYADLKMRDVSGESISMLDAKKENGLLVLFSCNKCPFVLRWEDRYDDIKVWADKNKIGMIVLNSNYQKRSGDDSFEKMQAKAKEMNYNFYYVLDKESKVANAMGGKTTPHVFLFDGDLKLAYKGAIDDNSKSASQVEKTYLKDAIISLGAGEEIVVAETPPVGCSIKRKTD